MSRRSTVAGAALAAALALGDRGAVRAADAPPKEHVLKEMERYAPLVSSGSYLVVQDTVSNGRPIPTGFGEGPTEAVDEFLKTHPEFTPDRWREKFMLTFYPRGFLKKR